MEVKISYGIEIDKVPKKIAEILKECNIDEANQLVSVVSGLLEVADKNAEIAGDLLSKARSILSRADRAISDSQMILIGYLRATDVAEAPTNPTSPSTNDAD